MEGKASRGIRLVDRLRRASARSSSLIYLVIRNMDTHRIDGISSLEQEQRSSFPQGFILEP